MSVPNSLHPFGCLCIVRALRVEPPHIRRTLVDATAGETLPGPATVSRSTGSVC